MDPDFLPQVVALTLVFVCAITISLASRRMERGDMITLLVIVPVTFVVAVLPGMVTWGLTKDAVSYIVGSILVVLVAILNRRYQPDRSPDGASADERERAKVRESKCTPTV